MGCPVTAIHARHSRSSGTRIGSAGYSQGGDFGVESDVSRLINISVPEPTSSKLYTSSSRPLLFTVTCFTRHTSSQSRHIQAQNSSIAEYGHCCSRQEA